MVTSKTASLLARILACSLALVALVGRDSSAKAPMMQAAPAIPVPNLVGYWAVDGDTGGVATDSSGNANDGTYAPGSNPATTSASVPPVPTGNTTSFNFVGANNQFINVPNAPELAIAGSITISAWVRPVAETGNQMGIVEKWNTGGYLFRLNANRVLDFSVRAGSTNAGVGTSPRKIPLNQWTHVAGVYDSVAQTMKLYHSDDDLVKSGATEGNFGPDAGAADPTQGTTIAAPAADTAVLQIGKDYGLNAFNGTVDEVRIYNRPLDITEVHILRDGQPAPTMLTPVALSGMNQLSWTPPAGAPAGITYSLLFGPSANTYTGVINNIPGTSYDHTGAAAGVPTFYRVVAVTVMASPRSSEVSSTPGPAGPPPPPPPPRTSKVGNEDNPCGCGTVSPMSGGVAALGLLIALLALIAGRPCRG